MLNGHYVKFAEANGELDFTVHLETTAEERAHSKHNAVAASHYDDVIMGAMASQITSPTIVYWTVCSGADQRKWQSSASLAFVWGSSPWTGELTAQMARNAENVSIWWHHHKYVFASFVTIRFLCWTCISFLSFALKPYVYSSAGCQKDSHAGFQRALWHLFTTMVSAHDIHYGDIKSTVYTNRCCVCPEC